MADEVVGEAVGQAFHEGAAGDRPGLEAVPGAHFGLEQVPLLLDMFARVGEAYRSATRELRADAP
ncbi:hypothetical protein GCM10023196_090910 [Actinoallomurus vinaceus]|uniref:Uncharacterized protein n=1 Tax=Actinoallomurus vinaceus TaxID=1080074 RepID=A0ABP8UQH8_9ACTN